MAEEQPRDALAQLLAGAKKGDGKGAPGKPAPSKKRAAAKVAAAAPPQAKRPRGASAYFIFTEENRKAVHEELLAQLAGEQEACGADEHRPAPKVPVPLVAKALGQKWKALSDEERQHYKDLAVQKAQQAQKQAAPEVATKPPPAATPAAEGAADAAATDANASARVDSDAAAVDPDTAAQRDQRHASPAPAAEGDDADDQPGPSAAPAALPRGVVKRLMMCDADVKRASADAVWLVGRAAEQLLEALAHKCAAAAEAKKRRTIQLCDFEHVVRYDRRLVEAGMKDIVDDKDMFAAAHKHKDAAAGADARAAERAAAKQEAATAAIHKITTFFVAKAPEVAC